MAYHRHLFSHPDYTVGFGISPNQPIRLTDLCQRHSLSVGNRSFKLTLPRRMFLFTKVIITLYKYLRKPYFQGFLSFLFTQVYANLHKSVLKWCKFWCKWCKFWCKFLSQFLLILSHFYSFTLTNLA